MGASDTLGQGVSLGEALLDELPCPVDVGAGLEDEHDRRQAGHGLRADDVDALHPVQQVRLERNRDELLDFLGGEPERLGLDLGVGGRELGEHVHRGVAKLDDADGDDAHGRPHHQQAEPQAGTNDCSDHQPAFREALTLTVLDVRLPALGFVETTLPLPLTLYLQRAFLSFLTAFLMVSPRTFGTLHLRLGLGFSETTGGGGGSTTGGAVTTRPILFARNSVNQRFLSGPRVMSEGSAPGVGTGKWLVMIPPVVIRPIALESGT